MKNIIINICIFIVATFLFTNFLYSDLGGLEMVLYTTAFMATGFITSYLFVMKLKKYSFSKILVIYPLLIFTLTYILVFSSREFYIPIFTPIGNYIADIFPIGHYGYTAFYLYCGVLVFLTVLLIFGIQLAFDIYKRNKNA